MGHFSPLVHKLYQDYGAKLYVVALEIAPNQTVAEKIKRLEKRRTDQNASAVRG